MDAEQTIGALAQAQYDYQSIRRFVAAGSDGLAAAAERRYRASDTPERYKLAWLLGLLNNEESRAALLRLLPDAEGEEARRLLSELVKMRVVVPSEQLRRLLPSCESECVNAAGIAGDRSLIADVAPLLTSAKVGWIAAVALAKLEAREHTLAIVEAMTTAEKLAHGGYAAALAMMGDPAAIDPLLALVAKKKPERAFDLHRALCALTGRDPIVGEASDKAQYARAVADAWKREPLGAPRLVDLKIEDDAHARFAVDEGTGEIRVDYLPPAPGSSWPRWGKGLYARGRLLYEVSSDCETCETLLRLTGSLAETESSSLERLRACVAQIDALAEDTFTALWPLLQKLPTGRYAATLAEIDLELAVDPMRSWLVRRTELRSDDAGPATDASDWPRTAHFQTREARSEPERTTFAVLLPSQRIEALEEDTVARYVAAIARGERPVALAWQWIEDRGDDWSGDRRERFLNGLVLDGHHKLAAYARAEVPARVLSLTHLESCSAGANAADTARETLDRISAVRG